jgi:hypothetical protein
MLVLCLLSIVIIAAILFYSICAVSSRVSHHLENRAFVFLTPSAAAPFEDLLAAGDEESAYRIMKALARRGDLLVLETEKEIYIDCPESRSQDCLQERTTG